MSGGVLFGFHMGKIKNQSSASGRRACFVQTQSLLLVVASRRAC